MNLVQFFRILKARSAIILIVLLSCVTVATIMAFTLPKRYVGRARVMLDVVKPDPVTGQVLGNQFLRAYTRTQIELIKDYQVAEDVVDRLGWATNPTIVRSYEASAASASEDIRRWLARQIIANTDADLIEASNILEITFRSSNPDTARRIADVIRETYVDASLDYRRQAAGRTADWYQLQAQQAAALVRAAEADRASYAKANNIVLNAANVDLESARLEALSGQSAAAVGTGAISVGGGGAVAGLGPAQMQLETINQQIAQAAATLGPNHPAFQALERQRTVLVAAAARERSVPRAVGGGNPTAAVNSAYERQKELVIKRSPEVDRIQNMTRDIEQKREQLAKISERAAELRMSANVGETGLTPMGGAIASQKADFPNRPLIVGASIGFGLMLGICIALLTEFLRRRVRSAEDLEFVTKAPVLAEIPAQSAVKTSPWQRLRVLFAGPRLGRAAT